MIKKYNQYINEELNFNFKNLYNGRIKNYPKIDSNDVDPYGEEDWDDDDLTPILKIAKKQGIPYDQITRLNCSDQKLTNLDGIENLINLKQLYCYSNNLTSLEGIENLTKLESLDCSFNKLFNLKGIENLSNLEFLFCFDNNLTNLDEIKSLINFEYLNCWNNDFSNEYKQYLIEYCKNKKIYLTI